MCGHSKADIAAGLQHHIEDNVEKLVEYYLTSSCEKNLCVSGGLFANVLLNRRLQLLARRYGGDFYVFPHMGDGGIAAGSAMLRSWEINGYSKLPKHKSMYLGPEYGSDWIYTALLNNSVECIETPDNYAERVAELIMQNKIIGHIAGRMEYGPRALGNRSILYNASEKNASDILNKRLNRTEFMPFAPMILDTYASKYLSDYQEADELLSEYMTGCFKCTEEMIRQMPGVIHVDKTSRAQVVKSERNSLIYSILTEYEKMSGIGGIINTSFNAHEEPIVCTPEDAIKSMRSGMVDYIAMFPFIASCPV